MKVTKVQCERCGLWVSKQNYSRHVAAHDKPVKIVEKTKSDYNQDQDGLFCRFCGESKKNKNSLRQHEIRCSKNPDRIQHVVSGFNNFGRSAWNKGLTADTDSRVAKYVRTNKERNSRLKDELELELDDDGKLFIKYSNKVSNARIAGVQCLLSFHEYCLLVKEAGLKSSDLGYSGNCYDLARIGDSGDYVYSNCRFIPHVENIHERISSEKMLESIKKAHVASMIHCREHPEEVSKAIKEGQAKSLKYQELLKRRHEQSIEKLSKQKPKDIRFSGIHNSQFGTFWITNGVENKKWNDEKGDIPESFYRGRVMSKKDG